MKMRAPKFFSHPELKAEKKLQISTLKINDSKQGTLLQSESQKTWNVFFSELAQ